MIVGMVLFTTIMTIGAVANPLTHLKIMAVISVLLTVLVLIFFRDPGRQIPPGDGNVLSPADGKVIEIVDDHDDEFMHADVTRIGIFMNVFNVHVNRIPIAGKVNYFRYQKGSFIQAYKSEAAEVNEQTVIGIENGERKLLFKQIAGLLARRIVCNVRQGNKVQPGERFGMIKFGSRVDIFLPKNVDISVRLNQKVKGGESIIGVFSNEV